MTGSHPHVPHPRDLASGAAGWHDRALDWIASHVGASVITFDVALIAPLVVLPMSNTAKLILGVISGSWFQWWMLPALQRGQMKADAKRDAKADADHAGLTHVAVTADAVLAATVSLQEAVGNLADVVQQVMTGRAEHDATVAADAKAARTAAESAFVAVRALAAVAAPPAVQPQPLPEAPPMAPGGPGTPGMGTRTPKGKKGM